MPGRADAKVEAGLLALLQREPRDVLAILAGLRKRLPGLLAGREGRLHALLWGMVKRGAVVVVGDSASAGRLTRYGVPGSPGADPGARTAAPSGVRPAEEDRVATKIASAVRDPEARGRIREDIAAHRAERAAEREAKAFGSSKTARHLLRRVDRKLPSVLFVEGGADIWRKFALHEAPWLLGVVVALLVLRAFVVEVFVIPTSSMVPTLLVGDRVVVFKPGGRSRPDRWTIVTFDRGDKTYVKRVAARGGERIALMAGDVYVNGEITEKGAATRQALRFPYRRWDLGPVPAAPWSEAGSGEGGRRRWIWAGDRLWSGANVSRRLATVRDVLLRDVYATFDAVRGAGEEVGVELVYGPPDAPPKMAFRLVAGAGDVVRLEHVDLSANGAQRFTVAESPDLPPAGPTTLRLAYVDGALLASVGPRGGARSVTWDVPLKASDRPAATSVVAPAFGTSGSGSRPLALALDKDIHYTLRGHLGIPEPGSDTDARDYAHAVPDGHVYLLGDNTYNSEDSRVRAVGTVPVRQLIGPVHFRIWPLGRLGRVR